MKKLFALILALLLLSAPAAYAETASVATLSDLELYIKDGEEETTLALDGVKLVFAAPEENMVAVNILGDEELLLSAAAKVDGQQVLFAIDGVDTTFKTALPATGTEADTGALALDLEGVDFGAIWENLYNSATITKESNGELSFSVPYTAVNQTLVDLLPLLDQLPAESGIDPDDLAEEIQGLADSNSGVNLEGVVATSETETYAELNVIPVIDGEAAETPVIALYGGFEQDEDGMYFSLTLDVISDGEDQTLFNLEFGMADSTYLVVTVDTFQVYFDYEPDESGVYLGFSAEDTAMELSCVIGTEEDGEITVCPIGDAESAVDIQDMTEEQQEELLNALSPLLAYLEPVLEAVA